MGVSPEVGALIIDLGLVSFLCGLMNFQVLVFWGSKPYVNETRVTEGTASAVAAGRVSARAEQPLGHKITVFFMWLMGMLQYTFFIHATYFMSTSDGVPSNADGGELLTPFPWSIQCQLFFVTMAAMTSKLLFTLRIYKLSRQMLYGPFFAITLFLFQVVEYAFGFLIAASLLSLKYLEQLERFPVTWAAWASMGLATTTDIVIAVALVFLLIKSSPNLGWTNSSAVMLVAYVVNSGALPAFISILILISYTRGSASAMFLAIEGTLPQIHINVFLAMLNARSYLQSAQKLNPDVFYIPTSANSGVIFQPPASAAFADHRNPSTFGYGSNGAEYHVRSLEDAAIQDDDGGETINELGLPLFRLGSLKQESHGMTKDDRDGAKKKRAKVKKPGSPTSTTPSTTGPTVDTKQADVLEKDQLDDMDVGSWEPQPRYQHYTPPNTAHSGYQHYTPPNTAHSGSPPSAPNPLEVIVQTTREEHYSGYPISHSNLHNGGQRRWR